MVLIAAPAPWGVKGVSEAPLFLAVPLVSPALAIGIYVGLLALVTDVFGQRPALLTRLMASLPAT